jgi:hypothetical protein
MLELADPQSRLLCLLVSLSLSVTLHFVISISVQPTECRLASFHTFYITMASHSPKHWSQPNCPMDMIPTLAVAAVRNLGVHKTLAPGRLGKYVLYSGT